MTYSFTTKQNNLITVNPSPNFLECRPVGNIINQNRGMCAPVIHGGHRSKALLPSRIPEREKPKNRHACVAECKCIMEQLEVTIFAKQCSIPPFHCEKREEESIIALQLAQKHQLHAYTVFFMKAAPIVAVVCPKVPLQY